MDNIKSKMIKRVVTDLAKADDKIKTIIVIAHTDDEQMMKLGAHDAGTKDLQALLGALECAKTRIIQMITEDDDEPTGEQDAIEAINNIMRNARKH